MPQRIRIEAHPGNPNFREFHATAQLSSEKFQGGITGGSRHDPFHQWSFGETKPELSDDTKATIMSFYDIDGIETVGLDTYKVKLTRSPAYEWEEIETQIITNIIQLAGWEKGSEVQVEYLLSGRLYPDGISRDEFEIEVERYRRASEAAERMYGF